jgi:hypothetical protein
MLPDTCILTHFMLKEVTNLVKNLLVYPDNMKRNMNVYGGVIFSQRVLLSLVEKGMSREDAYQLVQKCAHEAWNKEDGNFHHLISQDAQVTQYLGAEDMEKCFDPQHHLENLDMHLSTIRNLRNATLPTSWGKMFVHVTLWVQALRPYSGINLVFVGAYGIRPLFDLNHNNIRKFTRRIIRRFLQGFSNFSNIIGINSLKIYQ